MSNDTEKEILSADEELFEKLNANRKKRRRRVVVTVLSLLLLLALAVGVGVRTLRKRVEERFQAEAAEVKYYEAARGTVSTTVSGTGVLGSVDAEEITVPYGVELSEIMVRAGESVKEGDALATVKMSSVMQALSDTKDEITELNESITSAGQDAVSAYISAGVRGRVKRICGEKDMAVVDCMSEYGALCVLSLDGCMALELPRALSVDAAVTVRCSNGKEYPGRVESSAGGKSSITLTDNGPLWGDEVTVLSAEGEELGSGVLTIHSPLSVTGYAGTISRVYARENQMVNAWSTLFTLKDTGYTANYDALLQSRRDAEARQLELIAMLRTGALTAPYAGTVLSVDYTGEGSNSQSGYYTVTPTQTAVLTMAPDREMSVTLHVDESDILSLEIGQMAEVVVSSVSDEAVEGQVTEVSRVASSESSATLYTVTVTIPKSEGMLSGMTAKVNVRIEGVEDAVLIPVEALHQTKDTSYVYTAYDEQTQQYGDMVEVTVGISDGKMVEITSGLQEGERVYYIEESEDFFAMMGGYASGGNASNRPAERPNGEASGGFNGGPNGAPGGGFNGGADGGKRGNG